MKPNIKKIIAREGLVIVLGCLILTTQGFAEDSIERFKEQLPSMTKYQLDYKLNLFQMGYDTNPDNYYLRGAILLIQNQLLIHKQYTQQIRGLIQAGSIEGSVGADGAVFITLPNSDTGKKMQLSCDEWTTADLQTFVHKVMSIKDTKGEMR